MACKVYSNTYLWMKMLFTLHYFFFRSPTRYKEALVYVMVLFYIDTEASHLMI